MHLFGQTAYVMMALDDLARDIQTLNAVRINSALCQPFGVFYLLRLSIEDLHKVTTDDFSFLLGFFHACQVAQEFLTGIHAYHVQAKALVIAHHIAELILAQHAVVHEYTGQLVAYSAMQQYCHHR